MLFRSLKDLISKAPKDISNPLIPSNLRNYFEITPIGQKPLFVSVGLYNDPSDFAAGKGTQATDMDLKIDLAKKHILINLAHFDNSDEQQFEELVTHELIHAIDPKTSQKALYSKVASVANKNRVFNSNLAKNQTEKQKR